MARFTPEFVAGVRHDYEDTDKSLAQIAVDHAISERTVNRWRDRDGWARRSERVRGVPPATRALQEATALLARPPADAADDGTVGWAKRSVPTIPAPHAQTSRDDDHVGTARSAPLPTLPETPPSAIARIERLVEKELAAEEAVRAQLGPLPRPPAEAERAARTLATLTQTLHALARLRAGRLPGAGSRYDDDMPEDIDAFRIDLARRIDLFVASRTKPEDDGEHGEHGEPATVDEAGKPVSG
jgi:hypothetical protein